MDIEGERALRQAWEREACETLMEAGMLSEEAGEVAASMASGGWKGKDARAAAMDELRVRGWSAAMDEEIKFEVAGRFEVVNNGLE